MAAKKVAKKEVKTPKRFEVGYKFPVMAFIAEIDTDSGEEYYAIELVAEVRDDMWSKEKFIDIESECNPKARKEFLSEKLKAAQSVVISLTKEIAALDKA